MRENNNVAVSGGCIGFCGLLTIVFIVLKLCNVISWSWFWVLSPLIFSVGLTVVIFIIAIIAGLILLAHD